MSAWFEPEPVPQGDHPYPPLAVVREPGASGAVAVREWTPPQPPEALARIAGAIRHLDDAPPRGMEPFYAATVAAHYGTGPQPTFTPLAAPVPEPAVLVAEPEPEPEGTWLLDFLGRMMEDASVGAGRVITGPCNCPEPHDGWCAEWEAALARAARYSRLAELLESAPGDRGAVRVLLGEEWREQGVGIDLPGMSADGGAR